MRVVHLVVGAGLRGLVAAHAARARGDDVHVLETRALPGGAVGTALLEGYRIETGTPFLRTPCTSTLEAVAALGQAPPWRALVAPFARADHGGLVPLVPGGGARLRLLAEALVPARRALAARRRAETLHDWVGRRFGSTARTRLALPLVRALRGAGPARWGAGDLVPDLLALETRRGRVLPGLGARRRAGAPWGWLPEGGMARLAEALADDLGPGLELSARVHHVVPGAAGRAARVVLHDGRGQEADRITLAVPAHEAAPLLAGADPAAAGALAGVDHAPRVTVALGWARGGAAPTSLDGAGFVRGNARVRALGGLWWSRLDPSTTPPGHDLVALGYGGDDDRAALDLDDRDLRRWAVRDLSRVLRRRVRPSFVHIARAPRGYELPHPGHRARWVPHEQRLAAGGVHLA